MKKRVLVIEDDVDLRETFQHFLESEGFVVATAENGENALKEVRKVPMPDVILLDLQMPVLDGEGFLSKINLDSELRKIPVILVSATQNQTDIDGAVAYMTKPVNMNRLLSNVHRFVM